ncbi:MAG: hypothetical protein AAGN35_08260 [Bacteroidota bacterium]
MSNKIIGAWTTYSSTISREAQKVFDAALDDLIGVDYTPVAVATQDVTGTNYSFFCNGLPVLPDAVPRGYMVLIYAPQDGNPELKNIEVLPR